MNDFNDWAKAEAGRSVLQKNTRANLLKTLSELSDRSAQLAYKKAVPFVHVPLELLQRWDEYSRLLSEQREWFVKTFTSSELDEFRSFERAIESFWGKHGSSICDVPEILEQEDWRGLMKKSRSLLSVLSRNP